MKNQLVEQIEFAAEYLDGLKRCMESLPLDQVARVMDCLDDAFHDGRRVFIVGNGGSATTASHMACDLGKNTFAPANGETARRFRVMALTDNAGWMTALGNDLGYDYIFSEQLRNLVHPGDVVIAITGSGNSPNIVEAARVAKALGATVIGFLGFGGGTVRALVDHYVLVESNNYGYVEDLHLVLNHVLVAYFRKRSREVPLQARATAPAREASLLALAAE